MLQTKKSRSFFAATVIVTGAFAFAVAQSTGDFDLKDPKGVNAVTFLADSPLEPITGNANGITGFVKFDPENPEASSGKMVISAASVKTSNGTMAGHLAGPGWLDSERHTEMSFTIDKVSDVKKLAGGKFAMKAVGKFSLKGKTVNQPIDLTVTYSPDALGKRLQGKKGDILGIRTNFKFNRLEFDLGPAMPHVADDVEIIVSVAAMRSATNSGDFWVSQP